MNPTRALVMKDLRLSLDTLVPWALIVVGLTVFGLVLRGMPASLPWFDLGGVRLGDFVVILSMIIGGSAPIVAAWSTGAIVHGDRSHGAGVLVGSVPVAGWKRAFAKLVAIAGAALLPLAVALPLAALGVSLDDQSRAEPSEFSRLAQCSIFATVLVVGFMLAAAPLSTTIRGTLAWAIVLGVAASIAALVGDVLACLVLVASYGDAWTVAAMHEWLPGAVTFPSALRGPATALGALLAALVGMAIGLRAIARPRHVRRIGIAHGVMLVAAVAGGTLLWWVGVERQRQPRFSSGPFEILRLQWETDTDARDRDAARRIGDIDRELDRLRGMESDPAAMDAALHPDLLRLLRSRVQSDHLRAERAASLMERPESLDLGGWNADARR